MLKRPGFLNFEAKTRSNAPKKQPQNQLSFLAPSLKEQLNPKHDLYLLTHHIDWDFFEREFAKLYSDKGRPALPIRLMISLLILKVLYNLSDEQLVLERWEMNDYFQYFSGEQHQRWGAPCAPSDLVYFRKRIGKEGAEKILKRSIENHGKHSQEPHVSVDTTAQENHLSHRCKAVQESNRQSRENSASQRDKPSQKLQTYR